MKLAVLPLALFASLALAHAQGTTETGLRIRVAYGVTPSFSTFGGHDSMKGPELAVALPLGNALGQGVWLEPSYFGGGRLVHGNDTDADVFRLTVFVRHPFRRFAVRLGVGYAASGRPRGGNFDGQSGAVVDLGADIPFKVKLLKSVQPYVDVHNVFADAGALAGFFVGVGVKV